ncbi:MAG: LTA synthase family protein [Endomicrobia bacterium]|nr:LTA synthase family protein [Endomicrobiia bacterium]
MKKYTFDKYFDCLLNMIPLNVAALAAMTLYRVFFFFYFADFNTLHGMRGYVLKAFWLGMRFDLSVLAYINSAVIVILLLLFLFSSRTAFKAAMHFINFYFWIAFTAVVFLNLVDFGFYTYFNEHINLLFFDFFSDDTAALAKTVIKDWRFPIAFIVLLISSAAIYKLSSYTVKNMSDKHNLIDTSIFPLWVKILLVLLVGCITFFLARGTVSMFPLGAFYTQISPNDFINKLSISSVHSLTDALYAKSEQSSGKIDIADKLGVNKDEIDLSVFNKKSIPNKESGEIRPNVVFIVMESFGELPILYDSDTFDVLGDLRQHFESDTVFYNFLAAGEITVHALESTILNMPQRPFAKEITQSPNAFNLYSSAAALPYKQAGYMTKAVYGGSLNWRGIGSFFKHQGFDATYGEGDIKNEYRHEWGINDAQFFELLLRELKNNPEKPKFIYAMTTATHPPYETPPYYKPLPVDIPADVREMMPNEKKYGKKIFETYQFANMQAAKFLKAVKESELGQNTIVVITGDHNLREFAARTPEELFKKYAVPLYIYVPEKLKKNFDTSVSGCHMDIMPTLYDLSLSQADYIAAGASLLDAGKKHIAFNSGGFILSGDKAVMYDTEKKSASYFAFDAATKNLKPAEPVQEHADMLEYYKKILAASDIYLNRKEAAVK